MIKPYFMTTFLKAVSRISTDSVFGIIVTIGVVSALSLVALSVFTGNIIFIIPPVIMVVLMVVFGL